MNDTNSLAHTKWNCKYHIVFAPKYRRKVFFDEKRRELGKILRQLCEWKRVAIIEAEVCPDHIHMLLEIPPKIAVSSFVGYLKGKSSLMIYEQFSNLKYKYRNREFWCRVYYVDTVGKNAKKIEEYIRNQLEEDRMGEQLTMGADVTATPPPVVLRIGAAEGIFMVSDTTKRLDEAAMRHILDRYSDSPGGLFSVWHG